MHVDGAVVAVPVGPPYAIDQLLSRHGDALIASEVGEEVELACRQRDAAAVYRDLAACQIELDLFADLEHRCVDLHGLAAAQDRVNPGHDLAG